MIKINKKYQWIAFYEELADKLYGYIDRKDELFEIMKEIRNENPLFDFLNFEKEEWWGPRNYYIDPFSVMAVMNRGITDENRILIGNIYADIFDISTPVPTTFEGIPVVFNMRSFFGDSEDNNLWELFTETLKYAETKIITEELINIFDAVREKGGNGLAMITIGLYWTRPNIFMPLDKISRDYIPIAYDIEVPSPKGDGDAYFSFLKDLEKVSKETSFYKISYDAWLNNKKTAELTKYPLYAEEENNVVKEELKSNFHNTIVNFESNLSFGSLYFEDVEILKNQIQTALKAGKDIILIGPPGTGKSKIAKTTANSYEVEYKMVTAMSDWSSYDTIGGYKPNEDGSLYFEEGIFLSSLKDKNKQRRNQWLIIDEINRADIDKAFGPFLSALSGDNVELGLKDINNRNIELVLENNFEKGTEYEDNQYVIPKDWRIIGTMNTFDKASLYEMSYAFMRRFAFIPVSIPRNIDESTVRQLCNLWAIDNFEDYNNMAKLWRLINNYRKVGPAIVEDITRYIALGGDYISSVVLYVLPQLEGLYDDRINKLFLELKDLEFIYVNENVKEENIARLKMSIEDFSDLKLSEE